MNLSNLALVFLYIYIDISIPIYICLCVCVCIYRYVYLYIYTMASNLIVFVLGLTMIKKNNFKKWLERDDFAPFNVI